MSLVDSIHRIQAVNTGSLRLPAALVSNSGRLSRRFAANQQSSSIAVAGHKWAPSTVSLSPVAPQSNNQIHPLMS